MSQFQSFGFAEQDLKDMALGLILVKFREFLAIFVLRSGMCKSLLWAWLVHIGLLKTETHHRRTSNDLMHKIFKIRAAGRFLLHKKTIETMCNLAKYSRDLMEKNLATQGAAKPPPGTGRRKRKAWYYGVQTCVFRLSQATIRNERRPRQRCKFMTRQTQFLEAPRAGRVLSRRSAVGSQSVALCSCMQK